LIGEVGEREGVVRGVSKRIPLSGRSEVCRKGKTEICMTQYQERSHCC